MPIHIAIWEVAVEPQPLAPVTPCRVGMREDKIVEKVDLTLAGLDRPRPGGEGPATQP